MSVPFPRWAMPVPSPLPGSGRGMGTGKEIEMRQMSGSEETAQLTRLGPMPLTFSTRQLRYTNHGA
jgi:hypothetical protein